MFLALRSLTILYSSNPILAKWHTSATSRNTFIVIFYDLVVVVAVVVGARLPLSFCCVFFCSTIFIKKSLYKTHTTIIDVGAAITLLDPHEMTTTIFVQLNEYVVCDKQHSTISVELAPLFLHPWFDLSSVRALLYFSSRTDSP